MLGTRCPLRKLLEQVKLVVAVSDIGQAPELEDLAGGESIGYDGELVGEADAICSSDEAGGSSYHIT